MKEKLQRLNKANAKLKQEEKNSRAVYMETEVDLRNRLKELFCVPKDLKPVDITNIIGQQTCEMIADKAFKTRKDALENILSSINHPLISADNQCMDHFLTILIKNFESEKTSVNVALFVKVIHLISLSAPAYVASHSNTLSKIIIDKYKSSRTKDVLYYELAQVLLVLGSDQSLHVYLDVLDSKASTGKIFAVEVLLFTLILDFADSFDPSSISNLAKLIPGLLDNSKSELRTPSYKLAAVLEKKFGLKLNIESRKRVCVGEEIDRLTMGECEIDFLKTYHETFNIKTKKASIDKYFVEKKSYANITHAEKVKEKSIIEKSLTEQKSIAAKTMFIQNSPESAPEESLGLSEAIQGAQRVYVQEDFFGFLLKNSEDDISSFLQQPIWSPTKMKNINKVLDFSEQDLFDADFQKLISIIQQIQLKPCNSYPLLCTKLLYLGQLATIDTEKTFEEQEFDIFTWIQNLSNAFSSTLDRIAALHERIIFVHVKAVFHLLVLKFKTKLIDGSKEIIYSLSKVAYPADTQELLIKCIKIINDVNIIHALTVLFCKSITSSFNNDTRFGIKKDIIAIFYDEFQKNPERFDLLQGVFDSLIRVGFCHTDLGDVIPADETGTYWRLIYNNLKHKFE